MLTDDRRRQKLIRTGFNLINTIFRSVILVGISFVILYPLFTRVVTSFMGLQDVYDLSVRFFPKNLTLDNYIRAWNFLDMPALLWNTFFYPLLISAVQMLSASIVAYGFARYQFRFKKVLFLIVIVGMVIPPDVLLLPLYLDFKFVDFFGLATAVFGKPLNLLDTPLPFVILGITCTGLKNGLYLFMMRQYYRGLPKELEEAAYVDGAGTFQAFVRVFLPSAVQIMITVFLFSFVWQYLDTMFSTVFAQNVPLLSIEITRLLTNAQGVEAGISNLSLLSLTRNAAMMFLVVPLLLIYLFFQRYFTESIERSGLVG